MLATDLSAYVSPATAEPLEIAAVKQANGGRIVEGSLRAGGSADLFAIHHAIPRFVPAGNYADSFGLQWNRYRRVQLDSVNGSTLSRDRFFEGTGWSAERLRGARVLEAGCGAGRFAEILLQCGAHLHSFDYSGAVDAAWANLGGTPDWRLAQADIFNLPYRANWFDFVFCFGVLQHTPDPRRAFLSLANAVKPGGEIAIDVYLKPQGVSKLAVKYWYRPVTKRVSNSALLWACERLLPWWIPVDRCLQRVPLVGQYLASVVPCWNKWSLPISREHKIQWTVLDTFDAFSPEYDLPQELADVEAWFADAGVRPLKLRLGGNGIEACGRKAT